MDNQRSIKKQEYGGGEVHLNLFYPHRLSLYEKPPLGEITLENFQRWSIDRLRVLAEIEASYVRNRSHEDLMKVIKIQCERHLPMRGNAVQMDIPGLDAERRKDHVSHFILRLAFCRTEELRRRFVKAEMTLFRARFEDEDVSSRQQFLAAHGAEHAEPVDDMEKERLKAQLAAASNSTIQAVERESYIKIPWTKVPYLVEKRRVVLSRGMAYVPAKEQSSVIFHDFQTRLEKAMEMTSKAIGTIDEDDRLTPIINHLSTGFTAGVASEYTFGDEQAAGDAVTADMVNDLSKRHWPLCMRNLQESLRKDRHLKHYGRLQYGLFLKAVGMSVEEAMVFWRKSFSAVTDDKFNKEYRYNILHTFGMAGGRRNYAAKSCQIILTQNTPGPGDNHGCPFRHFSQDNLATALNAHYGIKSHTDISEIMTAVDAHKYHVACTRVFELTHAAQGVKKGEGVGQGETVTHPNKYAARSRELERESSGVKVEKDDAMDVDV